MGQRCTLKMIYSDIYIYIYTCLFAQRRIVIHVHLQRRGATSAETQDVRVDVYQHVGSCLLAAEPDSTSVHDVFATSTHPDFPAMKFKVGTNQSSTCCAGRLQGKQSLVPQVFQAGTWLVVAVCAICSS